jgi:hypothetical protein
MLATDVKVGTWTAFKATITSEELELFNKVFDGFTGVNYTPLAVSTQPVSGTNYRFFCNAKGVYPNALNEGAMVHIYKPINGHPHITSIQKID